MSISFPENLSFADEEGVYMRCCLDLTLYWTASLFDIASGLKHFYRRSLDLIGPQVAFYETEAMAGARRIKSNTLDMLEQWLSEKKSRRHIYMLTLHGGDTPNNPSDCALILNHNEQEGERAGAVRLLLPVERFKDDWDGLVSVARVLTQPLEFMSGHCGFGLSWDEKGDRAVDAVALFPFIARRFPGIDIPDLDVTLYAIAHAARPAIKTVNWLTFLGTPLVEYLGGTERLVARLGPVCKVQRLDFGIMIQAGMGPDIGDRNRGDILETYHRVGRLLTGTRVTAHPELVGCSGSGNEELTAEWLARFDD
ncbi:type VI immunity family protein [Accumulibacter sp.]|uniref:type VI immunity family protein n=1 Tax=Accumulibacter sp. TaxID=2053492 RepID=UPI0025CBE700|nr:type VI immunity family protein [Accumulibacter sp.]MCM8612032.1 DUF3396 domain-containing protein [Accumulibacter sp.]MCM8636014.1 DUF3396 domain-containing protein [Accumulibacter sp.]MCM8639855.1 DUF3396 domain-containing protein [Accumulibacter sp.]